MDECVGEERGLGFGDRRTEMVTRRRKGERKLGVAVGVGRLDLIIIIIIIIIIIGQFIPIVYLVRRSSIPIHSAFLGLYCIILAGILQLDGTGRDGTNTIPYTTIPTHLPTQPASQSVSQSVRQSVRPSVQNP
jgi:hypothetical protein